MKILHSLILVLFVSFLLVNQARAQSDVKQRVERYLYSNYNTNKAALRENDRSIRLLEESLDAYLATLDKSQLEEARAQERAARVYLDQVNKVKDISLLRQMVAEAQQKNDQQLAQFTSKGLSSLADVMACRKLIVMKLAEFELLQMTQAKLQTLLKDDVARQKFIDAIVEKEKLQQDTDIKLLARSVEVAVDRYTI